MARENPFDPKKIAALPVGGRITTEGVIVLRNTGGVSWGIYYRVPIPGTTRTKTKQEFLPGCTNLTQARGVLATRKGELYTKTYQPKAALQAKTLASAVADFIPWFRDVKGRRSWRYYDTSFRRHVLPMLGTKYLTEITRGDVERYYSARKKTGALSTANNELNYLKSLFKFAIREHWLESSPATGVALEEPDNARERRLTPAEIESLFAAAEHRSPMARMAWWATFWTGQRIGDVVAFRWSEFDLERRLMRRIARKTGKPVYVPLREDLAVALAQWKKFIGSSDWVFPSPRINGAHVTTSGLRTEWQMILADAGVPDATPHILRHTLASIMGEGGADAKTLMLVFGWTTVKTAMRYTHPTSDHVRGLMNAITLQSMSTAVGSGTLPEDDKKRQ